MRRVFIDSTVFIAAAISGRGSARDLMSKGLSEPEAITLYYSPYVLLEVERNLRKEGEQAMTSPSILEQLKEMQEALEQLLTESEDILREALLGTESDNHAAKGAGLTPEGYATRILSLLASVCIRIEERLGLIPLAPRTGASATVLIGGMMPPVPAQTTSRCSFCGKSPEQVERFISGPNGVHICNECVALCQDILQEMPGASG